MGQYEDTNRVRRGWGLGAARGHRSRVLGLSAGPDAAFSTRVAAKTPFSARRVEPFLLLWRAARLNSSHPHRERDRMARLLNLPAASRRKG